MKTHRLAVLILIALALLMVCVTARAVIQNQILSIEPNGAVSYTVWAAEPGARRTNYVGSFTGNLYALPGQFQDGTVFFVRSKHLVNGACCVESDFGHVSSPPGPMVDGTNVVALGLLTVEPGRWFKVSSDARTFSDWLKLDMLSNGVFRVEHRASPLHPMRFIDYGNPPPPPAPPAPSGVPFEVLKTKVRYPLQTNPAPTNP